MLRFLDSCIWISSNNVSCKRILKKQLLTQTLLKQITYTPQYLNILLMEEILHIVRQKPLTSTGAGYLPTINSIFWYISIGTVSPKSCASFGSWGCKRAIARWWLYYVYIGGCQWQMKVDKDPLPKKIKHNPGGDCYWAGGPPRMHAGDTC